MTGGSSVYNMCRKSKIKPQDNVRICKKTSSEIKRSLKQFKRHRVSTLSDSGRLFYAAGTTLSFFLSFCFEVCKLLMLRITGLIQPGDELRQVNGVVVTGKPPDDVIQLIVRVGLLQNPSCTSVFVLMTSLFFA